MPNKFCKDICDMDRITQQSDYGYTLAAPESFWTASPAERQQVSQKMKDLTLWTVPESILLLSILPACRIRDWCFYHWEEQAGFIIACGLFKTNMQRIVQAHYELHHLHGWHRWNVFVMQMRMKLSLKYYKKTLDYGERFYYGENK